MPTISRPAFVATAVIVLIMCLLVSGLTIGKKWVVVTYNRQEVEHTVKSELRPLQATLESLGFKNLSKLDTTCGYNTYEYSPRSSVNASIVSDNGTYFECDSSVHRYIKVPVGVNAVTTFNAHASELSRLLQANGWKSRPDYPTIPWFEKISNGVDYQPDQYNEKQVGDMNCVIDFFTAFSRPDPAALSMHMYCAKPRSAT